MDECKPLLSGAFEKALLIELVRDVEGTQFWEVEPGRLCSTDSECPSNSSGFDILRSSLFRVGKMGGGPVTRSPRTAHYPFRPDIRTSFNSRIRSPFDESQLPNSFH